jgi:hypothetical protein
MLRLRSVCVDFFVCKTAGRLLLLLILLSGNSSGLAASQITAAQLQEFLAASRGKPDSTVANEIAGLDLSERLSSARLELLLADLPGLRAREALLVLADRSAFLDSPPSEIPSNKTPDLTSQKQMIASTVGYVTNTLHALPNFYATRVTTTFKREMWTESPMHQVGRYTDTEIYRDGEMRLHSSRPKSRTAGLTTAGEFGPILATAILDAARGHLAWSHWEMGGEGLLAVFRYAVSAKESHYVVQDRVTAYEGEIALDPSSGAVLRIVLKTDREGGNPLDVADIVVEYGPVDLGGRKYICPLRGIALSEGSQLAWLNDVRFENYHLFRTDMRILPGFSEAH